MVKSARKKSRKRKHGAVAAVFHSEDGHHNERHPGGNHRVEKEQTRKKRKQHKSQRSVTENPKVVYAIRRKYIPVPTPYMVHQPMSHVGVRTPSILGGLGGLVSSFFGSRQPTLTSRSPALSPMPPPPDIDELNMVQPPDFMPPPPDDGSEFSGGPPPPPPPPPPVITERELPFKVRTVDKLGKASEDKPKVSADQAMMDELRMRLMRRDRQMVGSPMPTRREPGPQQAASENIGQPVFALRRTVDSPLTQRRRQMAEEEEKKKRDSQAGGVVSLAEAKKRLEAAFAQRASTSDFKRQKPLAECFNLLNRLNVTDVLVDTETFNAITAQDPACTHLLVTREQLQQARAKSAERGGDAILARLRETISTNNAVLERLRKEKQAADLRRAGKQVAEAKAVTKKARPSRSRRHGGVTSRRSRC